MIIGIPFGVFTMVVLKMVSGFISSFINAFPNKKLLNYSYLEQIQDIFPSIIISLIMGSVVIALGTLKINVIILLIIQMITGGIIYVLLAKLFKLECLEYLLRMINQRRKKL